MCGAGKTLIAQGWELFGLALGNTRPWQLWPKPEFLYCQRSVVNHLPLMGLWQASGHEREKPGKREKGKGMQLFVVTILPFNGEQFSEQQRMRWGKKGLLNSYGIDTNTSNIPRPRKGFVKILQVKMCAREFWDCLIFCIHKDGWCYPVHSDMGWFGE